jgi:uncharacterized protein (DUF1684 family)
MAQPTYEVEIEQWRAKMDASLRVPDGWLSLAGLFWLHQGANSVGSDPAGDIVLSAEQAPELAAWIDFDGARASLRPLPGAGLTVNGQPATEQPLRMDDQPPPDRVELGELSLVIIRRGARYGVRVRNQRQPGRAEFAGRRWFAIDPAYRVPATFVPYDPPKPVMITNILGDTNEELSPGYVSFTLAGQEYTLEASPTTAPELWFVFRDRTAGDSTYPAGRFLKAPLPRDGQTELDFNQAYNPPCAFTPFATCPLPAPQNRLGLPIPAGELYDGNQHGSGE